MVSIGSTALISKNGRIRPLNIIRSIASKTYDLPASFAEDEAIDHVDVNKFNKSGLLRQHRNMLHDKVPYDKPSSWIHLTEKYQRKLYGTYGTKSSVNPQICFLTNEEILLEKRKSKLLHVDLKEMMDKIALEKKERLDAINAREADITKKLEKLEQWKSDLYAKISKNEADAKAAKERKERLIEEVRRHFGFKVDPRDDRFKEMLEQKEKEDKRKQKEARRKAREEKMLTKLLEKNSSLQ